MGFDISITDPTNYLGVLLPSKYGHVNKQRTPMYDDNITHGNIFDSSVSGEADNVSISTVAKGVRVTLACVDAIRNIITKELI